MLNKVHFQNTVLEEVFLKDGLLCREYRDSAAQLTHTQIVVPPNLRTMVLHKLHDNLGHFGTKKTFDQGFTGQVMSKM